ncbi:hypothetical protein EGH21_21405 [Halomicroarcula sp. F13]|uniref:Uncharacterized protein n=1 Tax=Haloarcula rubra TaxID=2487747 RepID=A0AAW4PWA6_9EURY|nr:hypothetical protein [Halomicroarcula rubra]MBX0325585.1 hypothetical protein [Halomicroarcula rubra]
MTEDQASLKLEEAQFFLDQMVDSEGDEFLYYFDAFLAASRAVTLAMQKQYSGMEEFEEYYQSSQNLLKDLTVSQVLHELRNHTTHRGLIEAETDNYEYPNPGFPELKRIRDPEELPEPGRVEGTLHRLSTPLPDDVTEELDDETLSEFRDKYSDTNIEVMCNSHLFVLQEVIEKNPVSE